MMSGGSQDEYCAERDLETPSELIKECCNWLVLSAMGLGCGTSGECALYLPGIVCSYERAKTSQADGSTRVLICDSVFFCLFLISSSISASFLGKMAKRTFSTLETFLIFLLIMMTAITVALLSLLFITSGTIENPKGKCHGLSWMLCLGLQEIPRWLWTRRQEIVSVDNADNGGKRRRKIH